MSFAVFMAIWSTLAALHVRYFFFTAPAKLATWAEAQGYRVVVCGRAPLFEAWSFGATRQGLRFRVVLEDRQGRLHRALVYVPPVFPFVLSAAEESIEARWHGPVPVEPTVKDEDADPNWADVDEVADPRVILGFAVADLVLAVPAAWFGLGFLSLAESEPGPFRVGFLGFSALYFATAATMIAGGVGMLRRRRWAPNCHKVGACLFALTGVGVAYTVVALLYAARFGFNEYFDRPKGRKDDPDPFGDFRGPIG